MRENVACVETHGKTALLHIVVEIKEKTLVLVIFLEKRCKNQIPFLEILADLPGVAVLGSCLLPVSFVHVGCNGLMYCHIFMRKIIIILVIGIIIFELSLIERHTKCSLTTDYLEITIIKIARKG